MRTSRSSAPLSDERPEVSRTTWRHIDIHRQIRNHAVGDYYSFPEGNRPSKTTQVNKLPDWKREWPIWKEVSAHAAQQTVRQIHKDLNVLESHEDNGLDPGRLRWQGAGEFRSVSYNQSSRYDVDHNTGEDGWVRVHLEKIGTFPVRAHREIPDADDIDRVVLKKERTGEWFACFVVEVADPEKPDPEDVDPDNCVGIDLGILSYIHTSGDLSVGMLDLTGEYEQYAREQRSLDRKEHGSNNWEKQRRKVARAKREIKRKVLDFQHKLARWLVDAYDAVFLEDLDVKPMLETSHNAKNKQDAAWARFLDLVEYKGGLHGTHVVRVDSRGTTKGCNQCGVETRKPIWVREHSCPACGHTEDRDLNAVARLHLAGSQNARVLATAKNVLGRGLESLHVGAGRSESTSPEIEDFWLANETRSVSNHLTLGSVHPIVVTGGCP